MRFIMVITTTDNQEVAKKITQELLEKRLAGCIQIIGPITSSYWWQGKIENAEEYILFIKTKEELYPEIEQTIRINHNYTVPEIIAFDIKHGSQDYLTWLHEVTK